jgi:hypothetical protein
MTTEKIPAPKNIPSPKRPVTGPIPGISYLLILAIIIAIFTGGGIFYFKYLEPEQKKVVYLTKQVSELEEGMAQQTVKLIEAGKVAEDLRRCIEETENPAKRRALDMEIYITRRYPGVPKELAQMIAVETDRLCADYDMPFALVVGLMETESQFNPFAVSSVGARGLLQVMPNVWLEELQLKESRELHGIAVGINAGLHVLRHYIDKNNGNVTKALKNYNGTSGDEFHTVVYQNVGRFTVYRSNNYRKQQLEVKRKTEESLRTANG